MKLLSFFLWVSLLVCSAGLRAEVGFPEQPFQLTRPLVGQPVRQSVKINSSDWAGSLSVTMDPNGQLGIFYYMTPPAPKPTYQFQLENIANQSDPVGAVNGAFSNLHGMFGNLGGYFGRLQPLQTPPEELERRSQEFADFERSPWKYPQFLKVYRHLPGDIARKVLQHQRKELTDKLFQVLDNENVQETDRFAADNEKYIACLANQPWPARTLLTHLLLRVNGDHLFYDATSDGKEIDLPVNTAEDYHVFLRQADDQLENFMGEREKTCLAEAGQASVDRVGFLIWAAEEKALWAFDTWLTAGWRRLDPKGYENDPVYTPRSEKFVELIEHLNFELAVYDYLKRELAKYARSEDEPEQVFPPAYAHAGNFIAYQSQSFPDLVQQGREVVLLEYLSPALDLLDRMVEKWKQDERGREEAWLERQIAARPKQVEAIWEKGEQLLSGQILGWVRWKEESIDFLRHYPGKMQEALKSYSAIFNTH